MVVKQPIESYVVHSERLIRHAEEQLVSGDRLQASEKAWGAVAHHLKGIAEQRGWSYRTHADAMEPDYVRNEIEDVKKLLDMLGRADR